MEKKIDIEIVKKKVVAALDKIRPYLQSDGGDAEIIELTPEGRVKISFLGACGGCPMASVTLKQGIEQVIRSEVPEIVSVEAIPKE